MEEIKNSLRSDEAKISELRDIKHQYKLLIEGDLILKDDLDLLIRNLDASGPTSLLNCKKILSHLDAQIDQSVQDDQRMDDESPTPCAESIVDNNQNDYLLFKEAMNDFYVRYIKAK
jgi:hypothetical protein